MLDFMSVTEAVVEARTYMVVLLSAFLLCRMSSERPGPRPRKIYLDWLLWVVQRGAHKTTGSNPFLNSFVAIICPILESQTWWCTIEFGMVLLSAFLLCRTVTSKNISGLAALGCAAGSTQNNGFKSFLKFLCGNYLPNSWVEFKLEGVPLSLAWFAGPRPGKMHLDWLLWVVQHGREHTKQRVQILS